MSGKWSRKWRIVSSTSCCTHQRRLYAPGRLKGIATSPTCTPRSSCSTYKLRRIVNSTARLGTRASALARWQTDYVDQLLRNAWPVLEVQTQVISTKGDRTLDTPLPLIGGKGVFTAELE